MFFSSVQPFMTTPQIKGYNYMIFKNHFKSWSADLVTHLVTHCDLFLRCTHFKTHYFIHINSFMTENWINGHAYFPCWSLFYEHVNVIHRSAEQFLCSQMAFLNPFLWLNLLQKVFPKIIIQYSYLTLTFRKINRRQHRATFALLEMSTLQNRFE